MKKNHIIVLAVVLVMFTSLMFILNIKVSTKQGINYQVHEIKLPLYLKALDFIDRHYNYKNLVSNLLVGTKDDSAKAIKILEYINANVQKNPKELPVIDDHPLNILIRGYGVQDQFEDIFTILCTYAGMEAFFEIFKDHPGEPYYISFVKIKGRWCPFSAFGGIYLTKNGAVASVDDILLDHKLLAPFVSNLPGFKTDTFLSEMGGIDFNKCSVRVKGQSPAGRVSCIIKNMFKCGKDRISK